MSVFTINSAPLDAICDISGNPLSVAYDIHGQQVFPSNDPYIPGRQLLFEDNFDSFDTNTWRKIERAGNAGQLQYYKGDNVFVQDGHLVILAKREEYEGYSWTSGRIESRSRKYWTYGRIEAKIKFPKVLGAFSAFWTMGQNNLPNPYCGEIDIVEIMPLNNPEINKVYANMWNCSSGASLGSQYIQSSSIDDWHIYSMEWTSDYIAILFDDLEFHRWTFANYTTEEIVRYFENQYLIFNLAVGGQGGTPVSETNNMKMYVDWVRVYAPLA